MKIKLLVIICLVLLVSTSIISCSGKPVSDNQDLLALVSTISIPDVYSTEDGSLLKVSNINYYMIDMMRKRGNLYSVFLYNMMAHNSFYLLILIVNTNLPSILLCVMFLP
jgi:hypothetical protein